MIEGVMVTPLSVIDTDGGDVLHGMKSTDQGYSGFGEAYFSTIKHGAIKGWKRHNEMVLNLIVPIGTVRFVLYDDRNDSISINQFSDFILSSAENYYRLTVPSKVWIGFQGIDENTSMLLNIASIEHYEEEIDKKDLNEIKFNWSK